MRTNKKIIAVIGAGTMGSGIAQVAAQNNHSVVLVDTNKKTLENSKSKLQKVLKRIVEKGKITQQKSIEIIDHINYTDNLNSISSAFLKGMGAQRVLLHTRGGPPQSVLAS